MTVLAGRYASAVHDVMMSRGQRTFVVPRTTRPLLPGRRLAAPVCTASGRRHDGIKPVKQLCFDNAQVSPLPLRSSGCDGDPG